MLERVKLALRINHDYLNDEIEEVIESACLELIRAGLSEDSVRNPDELVQMAIKTYCLSVLSNDKNMTQGYSDSFRLQLDNLRKSVRYE